MSGEEEELRHRGCLRWLAAGSKPRRQPQKRQHAGESAPQGTGSATGAPPAAEIEIMAATAPKTRQTMLPAPRAGAVGVSAGPSSAAGHRPPGVTAKAAATAAEATAEVAADSAGDPAGTVSAAEEAPVQLHAVATASAARALTAAVGSASEGEQGQPAAPSFWQRDPRQAPERQQAGRQGQSAEHRRSQRQGRGDVQRQPQQRQEAPWEICVAVRPAAQVQLQQLCPVGEETFFVQPPALALLRRLVTAVPRLMGTLLRPPMASVHDPSCFLPPPSSAQKTPHRRILLRCSEHDDGWNLRAAEASASRSRRLDAEGGLAVPLFIVPSVVGLRKTANRHAQPQASAQQAARQSATPPHVQPAAVQHRPTSPPRAYPMAMQSRPTRDVSSSSAARTAARPLPRPAAGEARSCGQQVPLSVAPAATLQQAGRPPASVAVVHTPASGAARTAPQPAAAVAARSGVEMTRQFDATARVTVPAPASAAAIAAAAAEPVATAAQADVHRRAADLAVIAANLMRLADGPDLRGTLLAMAYLAQYPMTAQLLRASQIGASVMPLRRHAFPAMAEGAEFLVQTWRRVLEVLAACRQWCCHDQRMQALQWGMLVAL